MNACDFCQLSHPADYKCDAQKNVENAQEQERRIAAMRETLMLRKKGFHHRRNGSCGYCGYGAKEGAKLKKLPNKLMICDGCAQKQKEQQNEGSKT